MTDTSIKISEKNRDKMNLIKAIKKFGSLDDVIEFWLSHTKMTVDKVWMEES